MKKLILLTIASLLSTTAFAEVICQTQDNEYILSIASSDQNAQGLIPVRKVSVMVNDFENKTDKRFELKNLAGGYTTYDSGVITGEALGNYYRLTVNSMDMHVLTPKNDSSLRIKSKNGRVKLLKITCMTDGD